METMLNTGMLVVVREPGTTLQRDVLVGACCHDHVADDIVGVLDEHVVFSIAEEDHHRCDVCGGLLDS